MKLLNNPWRSAQQIKQAHIPNSAGFITTWVLVEVREDCKLFDFIFSLQG